MNTFIRWFLQIFAMISDLIVWLVVGIVLLYGWQYPLCWLLAFLAIWVWWHNGGFIAWTRRGIRRFRRNMKDEQA